MGTSRNIYGGLSTIENENCLQLLSDINEEPAFSSTGLRLSSAIVKVVRKYDRNCVLKYFLFKNILNYF